MGSRKEVGDAAHVHLRDDGVLGAQEELLGCHSAEGEARLQAIVQAEEDVRVEAVAHHAYALAAGDLVLLLQVVDHQGAGFANDRRLLASAALDRANHGTVAGPLLSVRQMCDAVRVCGDELATLVFIDAELSILDLVVVHVSVETDDNGPNIWILIELASRPHVRLLALVGFRPEPRDTDEVEFLTDALLADDVDLLAGVLELRLFQVCGSGKGRGEDLLGRHVEAQGIELCLVALAALGRVVRHKEAALACCPQLVKHRRNAVDQGVTPPDDTVAVKDEDIDAVEEGLRIRESLGALPEAKLVLWRGLSHMGRGLAENSQRG
mmetsp:Transcript_95344/g.284701  ORF Transcript_95344/g.284701 Transcript_95344/m.284701 type:complete len:324 (+) Transcript_95344:131-1102(+)